MSVEKRKEEAIRWFETAMNDYDAAIILKDHGKFSLACFHAQQAAEKAVKSLWYFFGDEPWGHSTRKLLMDFIQNHTRFRKKLISLEQGAMRLDQFYIPTRYPDGIPDVSPDKAYGNHDAQEGITQAQIIVSTIKDIIGLK